MPYQLLHWHCLQSRKIESTFLLGSCNSVSKESAQHGWRLRTYREPEMWRYPWARYWMLEKSPSDSSSHQYLFNSSYNGLAEDEESKMMSSTHKVSISKCQHLSSISTPPPNTLTYHTSPLQLTFLSHLTRIVQSSHIFLVSSPASSSPNLFVLCCTATLKPQPHHHTLWQSPLLQSFNLKNIWSELEGFCLHLFNAAALFVTEVQTWQSWLATVQIKRENKLLICGDKIDLLCA